MLKDLELTIKRRFIRGTRAGRQQPLLKAAQGLFVLLQEGFFPSSSGFPRPDVAFCRFFFFELFSKSDKCFTTNSKGSWGCGQELERKDWGKYHGSVSSGKFLLLFIEDIPTEFGGCGMKSQLCVSDSPPLLAVLSELHRSSELCQKNPCRHPRARNTPHLIRG